MYNRRISSAFPAVCVLLSLFLAVCPAFGVDVEYGAGMEQFVSSMMQQAKRITSGVKHGIQAVEAHDSDFYDDPRPSHCRAWKTKSTGIAFGYNETWKDPGFVYMKTRDPALVFAGGIKIGSTLADLEKLFGCPLKGYIEPNMPERPEAPISLQMDGQTLFFVLKNNKIHEIEYICEYFFPDKVTKYLGLR